MTPARGFGPASSTIPLIYRKHYMRRTLILLAAILAAAPLARAQDAAAATAPAESKTIVVSAEGLADPNAESYQKDKGLLLDALRADARKQVVEKAVGTFVESQTLTENYALIRDRVLTQTEGLIKEVIKESDPWQGQDGFMHLLLKAEVYIGKIGDTLKEMSKGQRVSLIKEYGNPKISVAVTVRDAEREGDGNVERSQVAENIIIESLTKFGYRVWSEEVSQGLKTELMQRSTLENQSETTLSVSQLKAADFSILGEGKFKSLSAQLTGGTTVTKYVLTSLTIRCTNNHTGEVVAPITEVPKKKSWADEDGALEEIGHLIAGNFSQQFFEEQLMQPSRIYQLQVAGLPDYDTGTLFKKEMIGLRPVLNVDFRTFDAEGMSNYELEFAGGRENFTDTMNTAVIKPLNRKFGSEVFKLTGSQGEVVRITYAGQGQPADLLKKFDATPPASVSTASPERLQEIVKSEDTMKRVAAVNPEAVAALAKGGDATAATAVSAAQSF